MKSAAALALALSFSVCGCASSPGGNGGDGKVHPPGNGVASSEADACMALTMAESAQYLALGCIATGRTCPDLLRTEFGTACQEYDQGSVQGCVAYYGMATTCSALDAAVADCAISPIADSAPKGCP